MFDEFHNGHLCDEGRVASRPPPIIQPTSDGRGVRWTVIGNAYGGVVNFTDETTFTSRHGITAIALTNEVQYLGSLVARPTECRRHVDAGTAAGAHESSEQR